MERNPTRVIRVYIPRRTEKVFLRCLAGVLELRLHVRLVCVAEAGEQLPLVHVRQQSVASQQDQHVTVAKLLVRQSHHVHRRLGNHAVFVNQLVAQTPRHRQTAARARRVRKHARNGGDGGMNFCNLDEAPAGKNAGLLVWVGQIVDATDVANGDLPVSVSERHHASGGDPIRSVSLGVPHMDRVETQGSVRIAADDSDIGCASTTLGVDLLAVDQFSLCFFDGSDCSPLHTRCRRDGRSQKCRQKRLANKGGNSMAFLSMTIEDGHNGQSGILARKHQYTILIVFLSIHTIPHHVHLQHTTGVIAMQSEGVREHPEGEMSLEVYREKLEWGLQNAHEDRIGFQET